MKVLTVEQVANKCRVSTQTIWRRSRSDGAFPKPFKLGGATVWDAADVDAYLRRKAEEANRATKELPARPVGVRDVCKMCGGVAKQTIHRWGSDPELGFPKPTKVDNALVWDAASIETWIKQQKEKHHGSGNQTQEAAQ